MRHFSCQFLTNSNQHDHLVFIFARPRRRRRPDTHRDPNTTRSLPQAPLPPPHLRHTIPGGGPRRRQVRLLQPHQGGPEGSSSPRDHALRRHNHPRLPRKHEQGQDLHLLLEPAGNAAGCDGRTVSTLSLCNEGRRRHIFQVAKLGGLRNAVGPTRFVLRVRDPVPEHGSLRALHVGNGVFSIVGHRGVD